ncbi:MULTISPECIES: hypothetical protein [unclassified Novosphingobium]|uniref:hypothetical protein n=1 Tax=unclassified Novosphingobium TaxID=2644732 RepID=UPI00020EEB05|nr:MULTISPECIES: hypothetical protein [unclassified Novosphingobium]GFM27531.1 putative uncharacterized protein [Novosphingobium sp. PY1]CCA92037.1 conserved hypothetical protein [Novosphingobium sp. PP1Y]
MGFGDVIAFAALMGALIAMVALASGAYKRRLDFQQRKLELLAGKETQHAKQLEVHCAELEQRLRVLERIVTDAESKNPIAMQIEALRDSDAQEVVTQ